MGAARLFKVVHSLRHKSGRRLRAERFGDDAVKGEGSLEIRKPMSLRESEEEEHHSKNTPYEWQ